MPEPLRVLHLDDQVVAVDKPAGLLVHRTATGSGEEALLQRLRDQIGRRLFPFQRLDRPASGVIAFGLDRRACAALQRALWAEDAVKEYLALVEGSCPERFEADEALVDEEGVARPARTTFVREALLPGGGSLVRARLHTGRRHQLRRHLAGLGHPIVGDLRYGPEAPEAAPAGDDRPRMFLHACLLDLAHPGGGRLRAEAPLPTDLVALLRARGLEPGPAGG